MRKIKAAGRLGRGLLAALLAVSTAVVPVQAAEGTQELTPQYLRSVQEEIIAAKLEGEGTKELLTGSLLDGAGSGDSDWYALGAARMGILDETSRAGYLYRLQETVEDIYSDLEENTRNMKASDWYRIILTATALGGDAEHFGADAEGNDIDLVNDGIWNCILGDPGAQGVNGYTWALLAADCGPYEEPSDAAWTREMLVTSVLERQQEDGGYALMRGDSDSDLTAMALTALAAYQDDPTEYSYEDKYTKEARTATVKQVGEEAFSTLAAMQAEDGTMKTYGESTSESTVQTLVALSAWGRDPLTDPQFQKNGSNLVEGLLSFQKSDGSFAHGRDDANAELMSQNMPNYQALYGLEACIRVMNGTNRLYDMQDVERISSQTIADAGAQLPERQITEEQDYAQVQKQTEARTGYVQWILLAAAGVLVVVLLAAVLGKRKKKTKKGSEHISEEEDW